MTLEQKCGVCGKKAKRPCPALGGWICPACCGSQRGSKINCARDCEFFPFGITAHELWLKIDAEWNLKSANCILRHVGQSEFERIWKDSSIKTNEPAVDREASLSNAIYSGLFIRRDGEGKTLADLWESESWSGLNNDEQVMMRFRRRSLVTVIEMQRRVDSQLVECVDLWEREPRPFLLFDRILAARVPRFTRLVVWLTHYPHFSRTSGFAYPIPLNLWPVWRDQIQTWTAEAAQKKPGLTVREFLSETMSAAVGLIQQISLAYRRQLLSSLDAHHCLAFYEFGGPGDDIEAVFKSKPDFRAEEPESEPDMPSLKACFTWLPQGESAEFIQPQPNAAPADAKSEATGIIGSVRLYPDGVLLETQSRQKFEFAKKMVEKYFGNLLRFQKEKIVDLAQQMMERRTAEEAWAAATGLRTPGQGGTDRTDGGAANTGAEGASQSQAPGPARLSPEAQKQVLRENLDQRYAAFLDEKAPALDGLTPRAAAKDPPSRAKLVELMKFHLHNLERENREQGLDLRLDWVLDELGLAELK